MKHSINDTLSEWHFAVPMLRWLLPLMAGILCYAMPWYVAAGLAPAGIAALAAGVALRARYGTRWMFGAGVMLIMFCCGWGLHNIRRSAVEMNGSDMMSPCRVTLASAARMHERSVSYRALNDNGRAVILYTPQDTLFEAGTTLIVRTRWQPTHSEPQGEVFDYYHYLFNEGVSAVGYAGKGEYMASAHRSPLPMIMRLKIRAAEVRRWLIGVYDRAGIEGEQKAVLQALTLGEREDISADLRRSYVSSGAMHVLAVSGLHVGVICLIISRLLWFLGGYKLSRMMRFGVLAALLAVYAFVTGLTPSVLRAVLMLCLLYGGQIMQRSGNPLNTLCLSAMMILLANPMALYSVSFQLSYSATGAICYVLPWLRMREPESRTLRFVFYGLALTIAAQLGTLPFVLYHFHQTSTVFFVSSLVIIPIAEVVIFAAVALFAVSWSPLLSVWAGKVITVLLTLQNGIVDRLQSLSFSLVEVWVPLSGCVALCVMSGVLLSMLYSRHWAVRVFIAMLCIVFLLAERIYTVDRRTESVVVCPAAGEAVMVVRPGRVIEVCAADSARAQSAVHTLALKYDTDSIAGHYARNTAFVMRGVRWLVAQDTMLRYMRNESGLAPICVDKLVAGRAAGRTAPEQLLRLYAPDTILLMPSYPAFRREAMDSICAAHGIVTE